jgi:hypothetical protein
MARKEFTAQLEAVGPNGAWTFMTVPFNVEEVFGSKARVAVAGTINGFPFHSSLMPNGDGTHCMMVNKATFRRLPAPRALPHPTTGCGARRRRSGPRG